MRERVRKPRTQRPELTPKQREQAETDELNQRVTGELDDILAEVDAVLEENAQEFVASYVQKGGE